MSRLKLFLRCLLSVALIFFIAWKVNWSDLGAILMRISWGWAVFGSILTGVLILTLATRWKIFLEQQKIDIPFGTVVALTWAGQFFNSLLPGSTGGDVFKIYQVCRRTPERKAAAASTVLIDRASALLALLILASIAFFLEPAPLQALAGDKFSRLNIGWLIGFCVLALAAVWRFWRTACSMPWVGKLARTFREVGEGLTFNLRVAFATVLAFVIHLLNFLIVYFFARALDIDIGYGQVLLIMPVVLLMVLLPVTINGHGLRELLLIAYFSEMGIHIGNRTDIGYQDVAVALSVLMVANDLLWSLPGGLGYLTRLRRAPESKLVAAA